MPAGSLFSSLFCRTADPWSVLVLVFCKNVLLWLPSQHHHSHTLPRCHCQPGWSVCESCWAAGSLLRGWTWSGTPVSPVQMHSTVQSCRTDSKTNRRNKNTQNNGASNSSNCAQPVSAFPSLSIESFFVCLFVSKFYKRIRKNTLKVMTTQYLNFAIKNIFFHIFGQTSWDAGCWFPDRGWTHIPAMEHGVLTTEATGKSQHPAF